MGATSLGTRDLDKLDHSPCLHEVFRDDLLPVSEPVNAVACAGLAFFCRQMCKAKCYDARSGCEKPPIVQEWVEGRESISTPM